MRIHGPSYLRPCPFVNPPLCIHLCSPPVFVLHPSFTGRAMELGLPYGLSSFHRHARTTGKAAALQQENRLLGQTSSFNMNSPIALLSRKTSNPGPSTACSKLKSKSKSKSLKRRLKKHHKANLSAESSAHGAKVVEVAAKEKRRRAMNVELPQNLQLKARDKDFKENKLKRLRKKPRSSSTRPGISKDRPITIQSDDDIDKEGDGESDGDMEILNSALVARQSTCSVSTPILYPAVILPPRGRSDSIHKTPPRKTLSIQPIRTTQREFQAKRAEQQRSSETEAVIEEIPFQIARKKHSQEEISGVSSSRKHRKLHENYRKYSLKIIPDSSHKTFPTSSAAVASEIRERTPNNVQEDSDFSIVQSLRNNKTRDGGTNVLPLRTHGYSWAEPVTQTPQDLTLGHIADLELRNKVAQLMAVAPGLPVHDLYHLLLEKKGRYKETLKQIVARASHAPTASTSSALPRTRHMQRTSAGDTTPNKFSIQDSDSDGIMVKIDFNDPAFIYDNDAPTTIPPPEIRKKPRIRKKSSAKSPKNKANQPRTSKKANGSATIRTYTHLQRRKVTANINHKRSAHDTGTRLRETSSDREFIVADGVTFLDSGDSYREESDFNSEASDTGSDTGSDAEMLDNSYEESDLRIDMQPKYAFNAELTARPMK